MRHPFFKVPLVICLLFLLNTSTESQTTLISYGDVWRYSDEGSEPANQSSTDWTQNNYDDLSWASGNAQLGYGDGDEATIINSIVITGYFRHTFNVSDPSIYDNLDLNLLYDDGAVIYLNGMEIWRVNMPEGNITYGTFAASTSSDNSMASLNITNNLNVGSNVIAVEVHQRSSGSSDISFDFKLVGNPPGVVSMTRGPYLQKGSSSSVTIKWRTSSATESIVHYGTSQGNLNQSKSDLSAKTEHELEINDLLPNTTYFYNVSNASNVLIGSASDLYFRTAPASGSQQSITAWILGDCGTANGNARAVRDAYYNYIGTGHTDMMLFLGDNAYNDGTDNEYQFALFENMYEDKLKNTVSWSCLGNHDGHSANSSTQSGPYYDIFTFPTLGESGGSPSFTEAYYSFDYGNVHFISLDSYESDRSVGGSMYNWCETDIQNTTADWIVAFWHHPAYTKGSHDSDTEGALIQMRENFVPMLEANGVDLVLSGHSHSYERSFFINGHYGNSNTFNPAQHFVGVSGGGNGRTDGDGAYIKSSSQTDGAVYITSGSAGKVSNGSLDHEAMFYSVAALGSCVLEITGGDLTVKFVRETGVVEDYFTIQKSLGCNPGASCDDGDPCTTNDIYDADCLCAGTLQDSDGDGVCDTDDQCPGQDDALIGTACDDGDPCTVNDLYDNSCNCTGTFQDSDGDGVCDVEDLCPGQDDALIGSTCDDGDPCTVNDLYDNSCNCTGTFQDSDGDGVCDTEDLCPGQDDALIGSTCDDGDICTTNDSYDSNCNCSGTFQDSDGDGVCDANDICPGYDDNIDSDGDGIPDGCEICDPVVALFSPNPLTHQGSGSSVASVNFGSLQENVSFDISDLDYRNKKKKSNRFIDQVQVRYIDASGSIQTYGTFSGTEQSEVMVSIFDQVQSVEVMLSDAYDGNSAVPMTATISDVNSCNVGTLRQTEESFDAEGSPVLDRAMKVFPNPASDNLTIDFRSDIDADQGLLILEIWNLEGALYHREKIAMHGGVVTERIDTRLFPSGTYLIRLKSNQFVLTKSAVITR